MTNDNTAFENVCEFENLYKAYRKSKAGKWFSKSRVKFELAALDGIYQIKRLLEAKTYEVSKYNTFKIYEPKERIIEAGTFKDKIVQHSLCDNALIPILNNEFIQTNYAGQIGKGTLYGLDCLKAQIYLAFEKYGYNCWIVKGDVSKFFYSIDHDILKDIVKYHIKDDDIYWLCEKFIDSTIGNGLPLGNQVSQVFALLYLSGFDHFVTGDLGVKYYGRYMDDFYLIVETKEYAKFCLQSINDFIDTLNLKLNGKTQIIPFKNGIKFCGFHTYVAINGKVIRKLTNEKKRSAKKKYKKMAKLVIDNKIELEDFIKSYSSWRNHILHGNCIKLTYEMDLYIENLLKDAEQRNN